MPANFNNSNKSKLFSTIRDTHRPRENLKDILTINKNKNRSNINDAKPYQPIRKMERKRFSNPVILDAPSL